MLENRLRHPTRAPSASFIGVGSLRGHRLRFHKRGSDESAKCNLESTGDSKDLVYGVLFEIDEVDRDALNSAEGVPLGEYALRQVSVERLDQEGETVADTYIATPEYIDDSLKPFD